MKKSNYRQDRYYNYVNEDVVYSMFKTGLNKLAGTRNTKEAWRNILLNYNKNDKITVKINLSFEARAVERLESVTGLFEPLLADFTLRSRDRLMVRALLRLLRWPGGAWLLRRWHVRRQ